MESIRHQPLALCLRLKEPDKLKVKGNISDRHNPWLEKVSIRKNQKAWPYKYALGILCLYNGCKSALIWVVDQANLFTETLLNIKCRLFVSLQEAVSGLFPAHWKADGGAGLVPVSGIC